MGTYPNRRRDPLYYLLKTTKKKDPQHPMTQENKKQIALQNLPRKANVNTNPIGSLKSLWSCSQIEQQELILSLMVTKCKDDQRQPCQ